MDCDYASALMMSYIDNNLSESQIKSLNEHLSQCNLCNEDFSIYKEMMSEFSYTETVNAPSDFEYNVMKTVNDLSLYNSKNNEKSDLFYWLYSSVSILVGFGFVLYNNSDAVLKYFYDKPELHSFAKATLPTLYMFFDFAENFATESYSFFASFSSLLLSARYYFIPILLFISIVIYIYKNRIDTTKI